jgi:hypothetical protein
MPESQLEEIEEKEKEKGKSPNNPESKLFLIANHEKRLDMMKMEDLLSN